MNPLRAVLLLAVLVLLVAASQASAGTWLGAETLSATNSKNSAPQVAVSANGDAAAVWTYKSGNSGGAWGSIRHDGAWGKSDFLPSTGLLLGAPLVAADGSGHATAAWNAIAVVPSQPIYVSTTIAGAWSPTTDVTSAGSGDNPAIAVDRAGDAVVAWRTSDITGTVVYAARRPHGGQWSAPQKISGNIPGGANIDLATNADGDVLAVWLAGGRIGGVFYSPSAGWGSASWVSGAKPVALAPQAALDDAGRATVDWESSSGYGYDVIAEARGSTASGLGKPVEVETAGPSGAPDVAVAPDGSGVLTWIRDNGGHEVVQAARRLNAGATWGQPADLNGPASVSDSPRAAVDPGGDAMVVWNQKAPIGYLPYAAAFTGASWSTAHALTNPGDEVSAPQVAFDDAGNATALFAHGYAIQAARYDAAPALSGVSVPSSALVGQQLSFAASASEQVTLSWDFGDGGTATGSPAAHAYAAAGDYTVKVTARDSAGNEVSETHAVHVVALPSPPPAHLFSGLTLKSQRITIRKGTGLVKAACPAGTAGRCVGTLFLSSGKKVVARVKFNIAAGKTVRIRFHLRRVPRALRASATAHDSFGATRTTSAKLKLVRK
jgi:hypothetical protein